MSGEAKTVSELCREALDLANKAESDKGKHSWDSYQRAYGNHFFNFAFQNIKQIAERCLELESQNKSQGMELAHLKIHGNCEHCEPIHVIEKSSYTKAVEALKEWHKFEKEQIQKEGPYVGKRINDMIKLTENTLKELGELT